MFGCLIPISVLNKIEKNFKKKHLIEWSSVTKPKLEGGLGLPNLHLMHKALLCKSFCRLKSQSSTPQANWVLTINNCLGETWTRRPNSSMSPLMKGIIWAAQSLKEAVTTTNEGSYGPWRRAISSLLNLQ